MLAFWIFVNMFQNLFWHVKEKLLVAKNQITHQTVLKDCYDKDDAWIIILYSQIELALNLTPFMRFQTIWR